MSQPFPSKILCPIDFSDLSAAALAYAVRMRAASGGSILAMHAYSFEAPVYFTRAMADELKQQYTQAAAAVTGKLEEFVYSADTGAVELHVEEGDPARSIVVSAETFNSDLIVMGTHGRRGWQRLMLGSVTERVLRTSSVPVLTVHAGPRSQTITRILVPVNNSDASRQALEMAAQLASSLQAFVTVVHVDEGDHPARIDDLCTWIDETRRPACQIKHVQKAGNAAEEVLKLAVEIAADLIVVGAEHKRFLDSTVWNNNSPHRQARVNAGFNRTRNRWLISWKEIVVGRRFAFVLLGSALWAGPRFEPAEVCSLCHSRIPAPGTTNENVAPYFLWTGTMKANSARDPYWKAKVREEVTVNPKAAAIIEDKCLRCHAPAQQFAYRERNKPMRFDAIDSLGAEGVTCTVCHQITAKGLGTKASFTAGFDIGSDSRIYGPHADPFAMPMMHHTSYRPTEGKHVLESAYCGTCHTVITPTLDAKGKVVGEFVEQAPYLEWLVSAYPNEGRSCASCHMPVLNQPSYIAHRPPGGPFPPTDPRTPFGRHFFTGGNVQGPAMLAELLPDQKTDFDAVSRRAQDLLSRAILLKASAVPRGDALRLTVNVENRSGHKVPTAYPSRRMWLHVTAFDPAGKPMWESGAWDPSTGELRNTPALQPHHHTITSPNQVMIYEAEHADIEGRPTHSLLRAARHVKDNRILPRGFDPKAALPPGLQFASIAPAGTDGDANFAPGSDQVIYEIAGHPARIVVEALYQSIKPTHAATTSSHPNAEAKRFAGLYQRHRDPVLMTSVEVVLPAR